MRSIIKSESCSIYDLIDNLDSISKIIVSTPETRAILNNPFITGVKYTDMLMKACAGILKAVDKAALCNLQESKTVVLNILRGGLNFGLRDALTSAFGWNNHASAFISAQRAHKTDNPEEWFITESEYRKVYLPKKTSLVFGDVVATGTSLRHALRQILVSVGEQNSQLEEIVFFTIGGDKAGEILSEIDSECRKLFPSYRNSLLIYLEGCFKVAAKDTSMSIKIDGTDLLRIESVISPEFIESQYSNPAYPLERCVIYDAGSRAFWLPEYLRDVKDYWKRVLKLAEGGLTFKKLLKERFPDLDCDRFEDVDLKELAKTQMDKCDFLKLVQ